MRTAPSSRIAVELVDALGHAAGRQLAESLRALRVRHVIERHSTESRFVASRFRVVATADGDHREIAGEVLAVNGADPHGIRTRPRELVARRNRSELRRLGWIGDVDEPNARAGARSWSTPRAEVCRVVVGCDTGRESSARVVAADDEGVQRLGAPGGGGCRAGREHGITCLCSSQMGIRVDGVTIGFVQIEM